MNGATRQITVANISLEESANTSLWPRSGGVYIELQLNHTKTSQIDWR